MLDVILREGRLLEHDAVLGGQVLVHRIQGQLRLAVLQADAGHDAHALRFDENLAFFAHLRTDGLAEVVVGAHEPLAVPAVLVNDLFHFGGLGQATFGFLALPAFLRDGGEFLPGQHEQAGDENRLGDLAVLVGRGLERLARRVGETVEVQAIVPVGAADERQAVRAEAFERVIEAAAQVFVERLLGAGLVLELHRLVEDAPVAGFLEVGRDAEDEPVRVVVEAAADVVVAALGERLILVERAAGLELRGGDVEDAFAGAGRNHLDEAEQVLVRIAEAEAAADAGFVERRRARHVERGHALVGVPDVDHAVGVDVGRLHLVNAEQAVPILAQALERPPRRSCRRDISR